MALPCDRDSFSNIVTITGTNFTDVTGVSFGGIAASSFVVDSPTQITARTASQAAGTVDVAVTTAAGTSAASSSDLYTFEEGAIRGHPSYQKLRFSYCRAKLP